MSLSQWIPIKEGNAQPEALCLFYVPPGNYIWATWRDSEQVKKDYLTCTHYKVVTEAPDKECQ